MNRYNVSRVAFFFFGWVVQKFNCVTLSSITHRARSSNARSPETITRTRDCTENSARNMFACGASKFASLAGEIIQFKFLASKPPQRNAARCTRVCVCVVRVVSQGGKGV